MENTCSTWALTFDPELEAALDEALANVPIDTPDAARRAGCALRHISSATPLPAGRAEGDERAAPHSPPSLM